MFLQFSTINSKILNIKYLVIRYNSNKTKWIGSVAATFVLSRQSRTFELDGVRWKKKPNWHSKVENQLFCSQKYIFRKKICKNFELSYLLKGRVPKKRRQIIHFWWIRGGGLSKLDKRWGCCGWLKKFHIVNIIIFLKCISQSRGGRTKWIIFFC